MPSRAFRLAASMIIAGCVSAGVRAQDMAPSLPHGHPILAAAKEGKTEDVLALLRGDVTVNSCTDEGLTAFRVALQYHHLDLARELMGRGFTPMLFYRSTRGAKVRIGLTPLVLAAKNSAEDIVEYLIGHGMIAYPQRVEDGFVGDIFESPVDAAVEVDRPKMLRRLLDSAPRRVVEIEVKSKSYPYLVACRSTEMIDTLVEFGADVNAAALKGLEPRPTVLHAYAERGWRDGIDRLLFLRADPTKKDRWGKLPQDVATDPGTKHKLRLAVLAVHVAHTGTIYRGGEPVMGFPTDCLQAALLESEDAAIERAPTVKDSSLRATDDRGWTVLTYALEYRLVRLARTLIDRGANVSHVTTPGSAMISFAAKTGDVELVTLMIAKGADVNLARRGMSTALLQAVYLKDRPMVELLLSKGAKVEPPRPNPGETWQSALMMACKNGDLPMMERLLKAGADLNEVDSAGEGIVCYAVRSGNLAVLEWVVQKGASPVVRNPQGENALTLAAQLSDLPMLKALLKLGVTHPDLLHYAERGSMYTDDFARNSEVQAFVQNSLRTKNPLSEDIFWRQPKITVADVRRYVEAGSDINCVFDAETPLQRMAGQGNVDVVRFLLEKGADPNKRGGMTFSAAMLAIEYSKDDAALTMIRLFLEHGVAVNTRLYLLEDDRDGEPTGDTLLARAIGHGLMKTADFLLSAGANPWLRSSFTDRNCFEQLDRLQSIGIDEREAFRTKMDAAGKKFPPPEALKAPPRPKPAGPRL